jgi:hypothetical protein
MAIRFKNFHEKFVALHQSAVLLIGLAVITISPGGSYTFFLPFGIAMAPILFAAFPNPHTSTTSEGNTPRLRTYLLSSFIGVLCALVLMGMWFAWVMIETFREMVFAG